MKLLENKKLKKEAIINAKQKQKEFEKYGKWLR